MNTGNILNLIMRIITTTLAEVIAVNKKKEKKQQEIIVIKEFCNAIQQMDTFNTANKTNKLSPHLKNNL